MWVLDPANSPELLAQLRPHALAPDFEVVGCGEGWKPLVEGCHHALAAEFPDYRFYAIKQKFGILAYQARPRSGAWTSDESETLHKITEDFAERSATLCEWCGRPGRLRDQRTVWQTLCDSCDEQFDDNPYPTIYTREERPS